MSCSMISNGDVLGQFAQHVMDMMGFGRRNSRGRLIEEQDPRLERQRDRNFQQPLLTIRQLANDPIADRADAYLIKPRLGFLEARAPLRLVAHHAPSEFLALGDRDRNVVAHSHFNEERVDLVGARQAMVDAPLRHHGLNRDPVQCDRAGIRMQEAGQEVDERGLAGPVRADQADPRIPIALNGALH